MRNRAKWRVVLSILAIEAGWLAVLGYLALRLLSY
jgi:hypothetical protein